METDITLLIYFVKIC